MNKQVYEIEYEVIPPHILKINSGTYIVPYWIEVPENTTFEQIKAIKKEIKPKFQNTIQKTKYNTRFENGVWKCNCMGYYVSKNKECKHIKLLKNK